MAKTYIDIVKYMVEARFEISGLVEKPDIIGAVFGQTEGLLGSDLDLRELQKNGKIGRIEIDTQVQGSRTVGKLHLPSSLGKVETCILGAAIESVDRVGPFETNFKVDRIDDTRNEKRRKIVNRAKELVKVLMNTGMPDSRELSELVESDVKSSEVVTYGPENLAAGPDIATSEDVIMVEGRADVIALLKSDIGNCIAIGGATGTVPKTIVDLLEKKETTLFLDGDRGGDIILKGVMNVGDVDYVARAPAGKEVEELTRKEIIKALRSRVPMDQLFQKGKPKEAHEPRDEERPRQQPQQQQSRPPQRPQFSSRPPQQQQQQSAILSPSDIVSNLSSRQQQQPQRQREETQMMDRDLGIKDLSEGPSGSAAPQGAPQSMNLQGALDELHNTLRGRLYNQQGAMISEIPIRELIQAIQDTKGIYAIVFDGIITQRLIELAYKNGVREVYGIRASQVTRKYEGMNLFTKEQGRI